MVKYIEAKDLPEQEKVYLQKGWGGWRVVHPLKNEDGSWNWFNIFTGGSWFKVIVATIIAIVVCGFFFEYTSNLKFCAEVIKNMTASQLPSSFTNYLNITNLSIIK